jgi:hypothetical protein
MRVLEGRCLILDRRLGVFVFLFGLCVVSLVVGGEAAITNILINPDFDLGPGLPWVEYSSGSYDIISPSNSLPTDVLPLPSGSYAAWLGGYDYAYDIIYQDITIPDYATTVELKGYRYIMTAEGQYPGIYDSVTIDVNGSILFTWTNEDNTTSWMPFNTSLSAYIGEPIRLRIAAETDASFWTSFFFDSLELNINYSAVGGIYIAVNKLELLGPYIGLTTLLIVAVVAVIYVKKRKRQTEINS